MSCPDIEPKLSKHEVDAKHTHTRRIEATKAFPVVFFITISFFQRIFVPSPIFYYYFVTILLRKLNLIEKIQLFYIFTIKPIFKFKLIAYSMLLKRI